MNATPSDNSPAAPKDDSGNAKHDPTPSEVLAIVLNWLRHYWDKERPKSKWHEIAMVLLTVVIAGAAIYSAWVFQSQLSLMRDADRPWIDVDIFITSPLTYNGKAVQAEFTFVPTNIGRSPAQNIAINPKLTPAFMGDDLHEIQKRICDNAVTEIGMTSLRYVLFPGRHYSQAVGMDIPVKELDSHWGKMPPGLGPIDPIPIAIVGCVDYTYESSSHHHQTAFAVDVLAKDGALPLKSRTPLAPDSLILRSHPTSGHYPN